MGSFGSLTETSTASHGKALHRLPAAPAATRAEADSEEVGVASCAAEVAAASCCCSAGGGGEDELMWWCSGRRPQVLADAAQFTATPHMQQELRECAHNEHAIVLLLA